MKIKVLLNCFNNALTLPRAIKSIINQTYSDIEICIIDKGSTDLTRAIINDFMKSDQRIKLGDQPQENPFIEFKMDACNHLVHLNFFEMGMNAFKNSPSV